MTGVSVLPPLVLPLLLLSLRAGDLAGAVPSDVAAGTAVRLKPQPVQQQQQQQQQQSGLTVEVVSSGLSCEVRVGGRLLLYRHGGRLGLHALSVNTRTGLGTGHSAAAGGLSDGPFVELASFVAGVRPGRLVILCQQSEAEMALDELSDRLFDSLNASFAADLQARSALALVVLKDGPVLAEGYRPNLAALAPDAPPAPSLRLAVSVPSEVTSLTCQMPPPITAAERRRRDFCESYDGYGALCECSAPLPAVTRRPFPDGELLPFPVLVAAGGRPRHLHRCLASLLANTGSDPARLLVIVDSDREDTGELLDLLRVYGVAWHPVPAGPNGGGGGSLHRQTLQTALHRFTSAEKLLLIDDKVEVSADLLDFLRQTHSLLDVDVSLYGVSAGNELGYRHAVSDRAAVYRVSSAPDGAWLLPRHVITDHLLPGWTAAGVGGLTVGELLRRADIRLGRECVVPEVPRFYRFTFNQSDNGTDYRYHWDRTVSVGPPVALRQVEELVLPRYQRHLQTLIGGATKLDGSQWPLSCSQIVPANVTNQTLVLSVRMVTEGDPTGWQRAAACLGLWDRDVRGHHGGLWRRRHAGGGELLILGVPFSPLAGFALLQGRGQIMLVSGGRSAGQRRRGRWPPGRPRPGTARLLARYRLSAAAAGLENTRQLEAALVQRGLLHPQDLDGDGDDGDLVLQDISSA